MAFPRPGNESFQHTQPFMDTQFDIFEWNQNYLSCIRYFLDHAQYSSPVQAVAAFVNIQLPFQKPTHPVLSSMQAGTPPGTIPGPSHMAIQIPPMAPLGARPHQPQASITHASLIPYIRRLVVTGFDYPAVLHGFFGDDWPAGIGPLHESERRNYLFSAKSDNWLTVKTCYDMSDGQTVPFLRPLQNVSEKEIQSAETSWSEWLAMQDWMLGSRAPREENNMYGRVNIKREEE